MFCGALTDDLRHAPFKVDYPARQLFHLGAIRFRHTLGNGLCFHAAKAITARPGRAMPQNRRHLTTSQRAMVAAKLANLPAHRPYKSANLHTSPVSQPQAAKLLNVSPRIVADAKEIEREAPELAEKVSSGEITVRAAYSRRDPAPLPRGGPIGTRRGC